MKGFSYIQNNITLKRITAPNYIVFGFSYIQNNITLKQFGKFLLHFPSFSYIQNNITLKPLALIASVGVGFSYIQNNITLKLLDFSHVKFYCFSYIQNNITLKPQIKELLTLSTFYFVYTFCLILICFLFNVNYISHKSSSMTIRPKDLNSYFMHGSINKHFKSKYSICLIILSISSLENISKSPAKTTNLIFFKQDRKSVV